MTKPIPTASHHRADHGKCLIKLSVVYCRRMPGFKARTFYDDRYEETARKAHLWSPARLMICLKLAFEKNPRSEADWGVVDALADLLAKTRPPE